jgi:hypothetical protein
MITPSKAGIVPYGSICNLGISEGINNHIIFFCAILLGNGLIVNQTMREGGKVLTRELRDEERGEKPKSDDILWPL